MPRPPKNRVFKAVYGHAAAAAAAESNELDEPDGQFRGVGPGN